MVRKLAVTIAALATSAMVVLALRQERLLAAAAMTRAVERAHADERHTWRLRTTIMSLSSLERIEQLARELEPRLGPFEQIVPAPDQQEFAAGSVRNPLAEHVPASSPIDVGILDWHGFAPARVVR